MRRCALSIHSAAYPCCIPLHTPHVQPPTRGDPSNVPADPPPPGACRCLRFLPARALGAGDVPVPPPGAGLCVVDAAVAPRRCALRARRPRPEVGGRTIILGIIMGRLKSMYGSRSHRLSCHAGDRWGNGASIAAAVLPEATITATPSAAPGPPAPQHAPPRTLHSQLRLPAPSPSCASSPSPPASSPHSGTVLSPLHAPAPRASVAPAPLPLTRPRPSLAPLSGPHLSQRLLQRGPLRRGCRGRVSRAATLVDGFCDAGRRSIFLRGDVWWCVLCPDELFGRPGRAATRRRQTQPAHRPPTEAPAPTHRGLAHGGPARGLLHIPTQPKVPAGPETEEGGAACGCAEGCAVASLRGRSCSTTLLCAHSRTHAQTHAGPRGAPPGCGPSCSSPWPSTWHGRWPTT